MNTKTLISGTEFEKQNLVQINFKIPVQILGAKLSLS